MELQQLARGLWRWTQPHPEWEAPEEEDSPADWPRDVGCVAYATNDTLVLIDPLVGGDYQELDELAATKTHVSILRTVSWHGRSSAELAGRYGASTEVPEGVEAIDLGGAAETMYWIPEHETLVPGDRILGDRPPGLRVCPESWLRYLEGYTQDDLRRDLRQLLERPVAMVLVSHGEPVLREGRSELERALA